MCNARGWSTVRIDGSTAADQRQDIVTNFNLYNVGQASSPCMRLVIYIIMCGNSSACLGIRQHLACAVAGKIW